MPGGKNPYTRPANKPERAALKRQKARSRLKKELENERARLRDDLSVSDEDFRADATDITSLIRDLDTSAGAREDRLTADNARAKQARRRDRVYAMEEGGKVPSKYKGFSKLPENVQRQMDSGLAEKYEYGGKVGNCRGAGAAIKGTKFTGCK